MDFPQQPQSTTPFPAAPQQPTTPPPFPNVAQPGGMASPMMNNGPMMPPAAGPMPGATMPPMGAVSPSSTVQIPIQSHPATLSSDEQVYTMPEKFLSSTAAPVAMRPKKSNKTVTIILVVLITLMILAAVGGVLYYFLVLSKQSTTITDAQNAVVVNNANVVTNANNSNANTNSLNQNGNDNANTNANDNTNTNANGNTNVVANDNTNTVNANTNTNSNANVNANGNTNSVATTVVPPSAKDTDEDSLTNDEEKVWGTKADLPDTDNDGYADGVEVLAGYDPTNPTGRLATSALVGTFTNSEYGYTMSYPKDWLAEALAEGDASEVLFTPNTLDLTGQFVAVTVTANPTGLTAVDWYTDTANVDETKVEVVTNFAGKTGVWSADRTTAYYADSNHVYAVSYRYGSSDELYFPTSFEMMVKSFTLTAAN